MILSILFLTLIVSESEAKTQCPPPENLAPNCICQTQNDKYLMMSCSKLEKPNDLVAPIQATKGFDILSLNIEGSSLDYIPSDVFENTKFSKIRLANTQLMALSESDVAFKGLEDHLEEIRATGPFYNATWQWSQLRNLKRIDLIDIHKIGMHTIYNKFPNWNTLKALGISEAKISFIHPNAFSKLPNLSILVLKSNQISEMKRSMLPLPADKLTLFDLSDNMLSTLPNDIFSHMPNLYDVLLFNNKFVTLNEATFSGILSRVQLLAINGNEINCDCRLRWLVGQKLPTLFYGKCAEPESLQGKSLQYLKKEELVCLSEPTAS